MAAQGRLFTPALQAAGNSTAGSGANAAADEVAIMSRDEERKGASWFKKLLAVADRYFVGYGYKPWLALFPAAILLAAGTVFARRHPAYGLEFTSAFVLSLQRLVPLLSFGEPYSKIDMGSPDVPLGTQRYFVVHAVLGYVLTAFLVSALTGLTNTS